MKDGGVILHPASFILFEVSDTGPGIPEAEQTQIFNRFYRADRARARETGGSGLGLAIVQRLVVAQGGSVIVQSRPGQGATFSVALPSAT
jgi:signal transduction histidine kinase